MLIERKLGSGLWRFLPAVAETARRRITREESRVVAAIFMLWC